MGSTDAEPIVEGLFRIDADGAVLIGGRSASSGLEHFPRKPVCPYTGADDVETVDLPRTGSLWYCTEVNVAPPGYTGALPYGLGIVELGGLRVVGRVLGDAPGELARGSAMEVVADVVPDSRGADRAVWAFAAVDVP